GRESVDIRELAFPNNERRPSERLEPRKISFVASPVASELWDPVVAIAVRHFATPRTIVPMPEAPVHQDHLLSARKCNIRIARKLPAMEAEPKSESMQ